MCPQLTPRIARLLPASFLATALGCTETNSGFVPGGTTPQDTALQDTGEPPPELNVVERQDPEAWPDCDDRQHCWEDYEGLEDRLDTSCTQPTTRADVEAQLEAIAAGQVPAEEGPLSAEVLAETLTQAMGAGCLFAGLDARPLEVRVLSTAQHDGYQRRDLLFEDPLVGRFTGILLVPDGEGPHPAVVAIHGHDSSAEMYLDFYNGPRFPQQGIAVLALDMRADRADDLEAQMTWSFLLNGLSFMGVRSYETRLGLEYLSWHPDLDDQALGVIAHSGGSVANNLTVWTEPRVKAYVSDLTSQYFADGQGNPECNGEVDAWECIVDETSPALHLWRDRINALDLAPAPVLQVPYDHARSEAGATEIVDWFKATLG